MILVEYTHDTGKWTAYDRQGNILLEDSDLDFVKKELEHEKLEYTVADGDQSDEQRLNEAVAWISKGAKMLGWSVAIPNENDEEADVKGMILGGEKYIDQMCECHKNLFGEKKDGDEQK